MIDLRGLRLLLTLALLAVLPGICEAQDLSELRVGHWIRVKGTAGPKRSFAATKIDLLPPEQEDVLIGHFRGTADDRLVVLGQTVHLSEKTSWKRDREREEKGGRIKVRGYYRGPRKFSARSIYYHGSKLDQIEGRIDSLVRAEGGYELQVLQYTITIPLGTELRADDPPAELELAPERLFSQGSSAPDNRVRDDDDDIRGTHQIGTHTFFGARLQWETLFEDEYDLDETSLRDRHDDEAAMRAEVTYRPPGNFYGLLGFRQTVRWRDDDRDGFERRSEGKVSELYGYWYDSGFEGLDFQIGRQDFDEQREWLYDQNLDALRAIYRGDGLRAELSASTVLRGGGERDEETDNLIAYVSNNDEDRHLAAYVIDRRDRREVRDYPFYMGLRALGEWLPDQDIWLELSGLSGYREHDDLRGHAFDLGTTWTPDFAGGLYFSAGYAFGSGDGNPGDGVDRAYRQTGLQDNNDRFGGVTSFRYYGELLDPELTNMSILTLGVGRRFGSDTSLDLVYHRYAQDEAIDQLVNTDLNRRPTGLDDDLGWELDLVLGSRALENIDIKFVAGIFDPGDAFDRQDTAYIAKIRIRLRL